MSRDPVIIELAGRNPWKDSRVWTGSSCKVESFIPQVIEKQKEGVIKEAQRQKERITERVRRKKKRKEKKTRLILENELELQTPVHDAPVKVEIRRSKMDETRPSSIDISAFVQTCLAFHGYSGRNPFFPPKAPSWLIPHLRGPIVHLLLERKVELWEMEKVLGEDPPEVLLRERGKVVTALKSNPNYLLPLKLWLMRSLEA